MIPTAQPQPTYQIYQGCSPQRFASDFLNHSPVTLQAFCMKERIPPEQLPRLIDEVLIDWELAELTHTTRSEALRHLINHIRIKVRNAQRNNQSRPLRQFASPNQDADERMADIAQELLRQSARHNQP